MCLTTSELASLLVRAPMPLASYVSEPSLSVGGHTSAATCLAVLYEPQDTRIKKGAPACSQGVLAWFQGPFTWFQGPRIRAVETCKTCGRAVTVQRRPS
jgi:hypothetical protein